VELVSHARAAARGGVGVALAPGASPGEQYVYSDVGFIVLAALVQRVTGLRLDEAVRRGVTEPLGMKETGYNPSPELRNRIAATEYEVEFGRGMVWGQVHDENAWSLDGVAGHAGVFSTASDMAIFCQMLLNGGQYRGARILREATVREALVDYNARLEDKYPTAARGLGFELNQIRYMGPLTSPVTFGHTGFTGTSVVIDPLSHSFLILLSNRVHPDRNWGGNNASRQTLARDLGYAMPVRPVGGGTAWRADRTDGGTFTLRASLPDQPDDTAASFLLWYDTEPLRDIVRFESSTDGGDTWSPTTMRLSGGGWRWSADGQLSGYGARRWLRVSADLPHGTTDIRWRYKTNAAAQGRGVYVDQMRVGGADVDHVIADGWTLASD